MYPFENFIFILSFYTHHTAGVSFTFNSKQKQYDKSCCRNPGLLAFSCFHTSEKIRLIMSSPYLFLSARKVRPVYIYMVFLLPFLIFALVRKLH